MLGSRPTWTTAWSSARAVSNTLLDFATVSFDYAGQLVDATGNVTLVRTEGGARPIIQA